MCNVTQVVDGFIANVTAETAPMSTMGRRSVNLHLYSISLHLSGDRDPSRHGLIEALGFSSVGAYSSIFISLCLFKYL